MTDMIEKVARAICRSDHPCWSMVNEIMDMPSYAPGHEGNAEAITIAGVYRQRAEAAFEQSAALTLKPALEAGFLLGFKASGEGFNAEYPYADKGSDPTKDEHWVAIRDREINSHINEILDAALTAHKEGE